MKWGLHIALISMICLVTGQVQPVMSQASTQEILQEIRSAYERVEFDVAERRIQEALNQYERFSPVELTQVHVFSALVNYAQDNAAEAETQLGLAYQLSPNLELDPVLAPPGLVAIANQLKQVMLDSGQRAEEEPEVRYLLLDDPRPAAAMRSMVLPGWGQMYKGDKRKGYTLLGAWGITAGGTLAAHILRANAENKYLDATTSEQATSLYDDFNQWHQVRNNLFLAAAGVWAYSYIDALIFQSPPQNRRLQFYALPAPKGAQMHVFVQF